MSSRDDAPVGELERWKREATRWHDRAQDNELRRLAAFFVGGILGSLLTTAIYALIIYKFGMPP